MDWMMSITAGIPIDSEFFNATTKAKWSVFIPRVPCMCNNKRPYRIKRANQRARTRQCNCVDCDTVTVEFLPVYFIQAASQRERVVLAHFIILTLVARAHALISSTGSRWRVGCFPMTIIILPTRHQLYKTVLITARLQICECALHCEYFIKSHLFCAAADGRTRIYLCSREIRLPVARALIFPNNKSSGCVCVFSAVLFSRRLLVGRVRPE